MRRGLFRGMFESEDGMKKLSESCGTSVHGAESIRLVLYRETIRMSGH
jgi:hypothetical protein